LISKPHQNLLLKAEKNFLGFFIALKIHNWKNLDIFYLHKKKD